MPTEDSGGVGKSTGGLDLTNYPGLSQNDAQERTQTDGPNELPKPTTRSVLAIALEVAREPMFIMLVAAGSLYLLMGETPDALMLLGFVLVVMGITVVQARRTERSLESLRELSSPEAHVVRDGVQRKIPGREVAKGDIVILAEGDRIPADGILRRGTHIRVDESLLTGESATVDKAESTTDTLLAKPGTADSSALFSGTLVTSGQGLAEVTAIGIRSELGKIGKLLQQIKPEPTRLQRETAQMVRVFATIGVAASLIVVIVYTVTRGGTMDVLKQGLLAGIAMAMSILPEELPVILTIFLALGAFRLANKNVLTRRMPAIEMLGRTTVLCVDKTGTLTSNQMTLVHLATLKLSTPLSPDTHQLVPEFHPLLRSAVFASSPDPFDAMERSLHEAGRRLLEPHTTPDGNWTLLRTYPLTPEVTAVTQVWRHNTKANLTIMSKGAPESIADLCHLSLENRLALTRQVDSLASKGLRVLGVAETTMSDAELPDDPLSLSLSLSGLLGFEDPLRPNVEPAIRDCQTAGIRVIMITGDYPTTAQNIAAQAGFEHPDDLVTGLELEKMSSEQLTARAQRVGVFARVFPEQKLRIVDALKTNGDIVAMTGDGVNDAPALKSAHIGIAMGQRGTDVAREAADLVLLDDDFSSIVAAVRLGRRIYDNIRKAIAFTLAVHIPIAGLSILPVFFADWPLLLLPTHIVFLELIIDPSCSLVFEAEKTDPNIMLRPPRTSDDRMFSRATAIGAAFQGLSVFAACVLVLLVAKQSHSPEQVRALTFCTLVAGVISILLTNRSQERTILRSMMTPNAALWAVLFGAGLFLPIVLLVPFAQQLFKFAPLRAGEVVLSLSAGAICALGFDAVILLKSWLNHRSPEPI